MTQKKINGYLIFTKQILGSGAFGCVYRAQQDGTLKQCAVKVIQKMKVDHDSYLKAALFSQMQILQMLKSQNIVRVIDAMQSNHNYYIVQQMCDSDLAHYMEKKPNMSEEQAIDILKQICNGFLALVKEGIIHRDIKPANILLKKGIVKIGDFGFAKKNLTKQIQNKTGVGTPLYMSVQMLKGESYTSKCDIWAIGCILYQILHGKSPWVANTQVSLVYKIQTVPLQIKPSLREQTKDFLKRCLQVRQKTRISWDEIFVHPIFKGVFDQYKHENQNFQNKLKRVMGELRFQINSNNIDLNRLLEGLAFNETNQIKCDQFFNFLRHIQPRITNDQIKFVFDQIDRNKDGLISLTQLGTQMEHHRIYFNKNKEHIKKATFIKRLVSTEEGPNKLPPPIELKARKCFQKLYKILQNKKLSFYKTFSAYDTEKTGQLTKAQFRNFMKRLDYTISQDEVQIIFQYIDSDQSRTIQFEQFLTFYCKVNGIPETLELPTVYYEKMSNKYKQ